MPSFEYTAIAAGGGRVKGVLAAASEAAVLAELEAKQLTAVSVCEQREGRGFGRRISSARLARAYLQIADLLRAGVPVMRALSLLGRQKSDRRLAAVFRRLAEHVGEGGEISEAMETQPQVFPRIHVAMIRAGERGGFLEQVFQRLGQYVQSQAELRSKVIGNMIYPCVLMGVGLILLAVIFTVFVPNFESVFDGLKERGELPAITSALFFVSHALGRYGLVTLVVLVIAGVALWRASKRSDVRRFLVVARTRLPVIGTLTRAMATARFCRMLGTMEANGVPLLTAMQIARHAAGNILMEEAIDEAIEAVRAGESLAGPLGQSGMFDEDVIEMISVGEAAGNVDEVMLGIAETVEGRVNRLLDTAVRLIEPLMLLLIAGVVVLVAVSLLLPMLKMSAAL
ncbi:MAG: type II secretion system F family protein [Planctomycetota bacterium]|nr:MAG: type II secretion system F family protein [Planctomycetota bacterium]